MSTSDARIVDRGYRRYEGPRRGGAGAYRSLVVHSAQRALGLRRPATAKILPVLSVFIAYVPAIVFVGIAVSFLGIAAIVSRGSIGELFALRLNAGDLLILAAMPVWGVYTVLFRRRPPGAERTDPAWRARPLHGPGLPGSALGGPDHGAGHARPCRADVHRQHRHPCARAVRTSSRRRRATDARQRLRLGAPVARDHRPSDEPAVRGPDRGCRVSPRSRSRSV